MSTRCNVKIIDHLGKKENLWFYRHSDGYPDGTLPTLKKFMKWVVEGKIRNNVSQASGWLILIGAEEYNVNRSFSNDGKDYGKPLPPKQAFNPMGKKSSNDWKCGAYEPTTGEHGDIEYLYKLDLTKKTITYEENGKKIIITDFSK